MIFYSIWWNQVHFTIILVLVSFLYGCKRFFCSVDLRVSLYWLLYQQYADSESIICWEFSLFVQPTPLFLVSWMISSTRPEVDFRHPYDEYLLLKLSRPLIGLLEVDLQSYFISEQAKLIFFNNLEHVKMLYFYK